MGGFSIPAIACIIPPSNMLKNNTPILVTGASGFIAIYCIIQLLEQGYYVRGTLRTIQRESELRKTVRVEKG